MPDLRARYVATEPLYRDAILARELVIGMRKQDVLASYQLWSVLQSGTEWEPYRALDPAPEWALWDHHSTLTKEHSHEQWVLKREFSTRYLYFDDEILTAVQD